MKKEISCQLGRQREGLGVCKQAVLRPVEAEGLEGTREEGEGQASGPSGQLRAFVQLHYGFFTSRRAWMGCRSRKVGTRVWKLLEVAVGEQVANT